MRQGLSLFCQIQEFAKLDVYGLSATEASNQLEDLLIWPILAGICHVAFGRFPISRSVKPVRSKSGCRSPLAP